MPHYATLKDYQFKDRVDDIRGTDLYGVDGDKLGTIDDVIFEHGSGAVKYCVVDTGGWLSSKKFLVPAERIHSFDRDPDALQVDLLKEHIERVFPAYDENSLDRDKDWRDYEDRYHHAATDNRVWEHGPVMHKRGSTRSITPEAAEMPAGSGQAEDLRGADIEPRRLAGKFTSTMPGAGKLEMVPEGTRPTERSFSAVNEAFVPPEGEPSFSATREFGELDRSLSDEDFESSMNERHEHREGKVEEISSSPKFHPAEVQAPAPLGSMGEDIQPIAEPNAGRPRQPIVEVGAQDGPETLSSDNRAMSAQRRDAGESHRLQDRNMNEVAHPVEDVRGTGRVRVGMDDMHSRPERWRRFEDLLRANRVDIEAKCAQCAPAKNKKVG
jgi:sporulation protein YlmC with PRC-barrel domain